jgi:hypothetical protein
MHTQFGSGWADAFIGVARMSLKTVSEAIWNMARVIPTGWGRETLMGIYESTDRMVLKSLSRRGVPEWVSKETVEGGVLPKLQRVAKNAQSMLTGSAMSANERLRGVMGRQIGKEAMGQELEAADRTMMDRIVGLASVDNIPNVLQAIAPRREKIQPPADTTNLPRQRRQPGETVVTRFKNESNRPADGRALSQNRRGRTIPGADDYDEHIYPKEETPEGVETYNQGASLKHFENLAMAPFRNGNTMANAEWAYQATAAMDQLKPEYNKKNYWSTYRVGKPGLDHSLVSETRLKETSGQNTYVEDTRHLPSRRIHDVVSMWSDRQGPRYGGPRPVRYEV